MVIKKASLSPNEKVFFSNINVYDFFFRSWTENCRTLLMNLQPIVKKAFFLSRRTFSGRVNLFWKKTLTVRCFLSEFWPNIFRISGKNGISTENISTVVKTALFASRGNFWAFFPETIQMQKIFATGAELRWVLSKIFGRFVKRASRRPDAFVEEKYMFFWRNNRLQMFFSRWEEFCWTLAQ